MVSEGVDGTDVSQEGPPTLLYHEVDSKINNLNPNGVYQFRVVAQVTIMGQLYSGDIPSSGSSITPG